MTTPWARDSRAAGGKRCILTELMAGADGYLVKPIAVDLPTGARAGKGSVLPGSYETRKAGSSIREGDGRPTAVAISSIPRRD